MLQKDSQHTGFVPGSAPNSPKLKFSEDPYGDINYGTDTSSSILIDGPKKVTAVWENDTSSLALLAIPIGVALVGFVVAGVVIFKEKKRETIIIRNERPT
jgi:hypothetical protein